MARAVSPQPARLHSLDGLRGIAATVVMLYHLSLVARPFLDTGREGDAWWWMTQTPLKVLTAGTEAVLVFFVLSGLVVALPALRSGFSWTTFLVSRLARLYLPVWGSLAFAVVLIVVFPRNPDAVTGGAWVDRANATTAQLPQLLSEASLWRVSYDLNNVLWSLRWELVFSVSLPILLALAIAFKRQWMLAAALAIVTTIAGRLTGFDALVYLPVFFLGTLAAVRMPELLRWAERRSRLSWALIGAASTSLLVGSWLARPLESDSGAEVLWALSGVGAAGLVLTAVGSPFARRVLSSAVPRWLGRVSFSLYLVQAPIIATLAFTLGDGNWLLIAGLAVPACLVVAWVFHLVVERPSHLLARRIGTVIRARLPAPRVAVRSGL